MEVEVAAGNLNPRRLSEEITSVWKQKTKYKKGGEENRR